MNSSIAGSSSCQGPPLTLHCPPLAERSRPTPWQTVEAPGFRASRIDQALVWLRLDHGASSFRQACFLAPPSGNLILIHAAVLTPREGPWQALGRALAFRPLLVGCALAASSSALAAEVYRGRQAAPTADGGNPPFPLDTRRRRG
jgi:hypothetical protein